MTDQAEPRWLSQEEQHAWFGVTAIMWSLPGPLDAQLERDSGLNLFEYFVLGSLSMSPGRQRRMSEIAAQSSASPSRVSNVVARLEGRGWVTRRPDEHDRRSTIATLTEAGWDKVVAAAPGHIAEVRRLLIDGRTPEQLAVLRDVGVSVARQALGDRCADSLLPEAP
ncbi:MarR family winged helix-turn-helix transcriptional regulator [Nocardioides sp. cx-173]|uniref:MarR family winged helix-turn-helix transcriptional regulator n=1 Tax=Nocardioides sp. cx-173 TaxID=2898796 RepID=UPI001E521E08|nr:MarR family transcriptional regulator [Nocardioides sp. cx-173]MCD4523689.1 MarR family transcriptional regulator [Nocardioides sp. cx-173]UGB41981.1 MarR family transcriptional regulator [Nocardioides sp. cx-173]